jgi:hypothetical protein
MMTSPPSGWVAPITNAFVSAGVTISNIIYCIIPDVSWRVASPDPAPVGYAWEAYHWLRGFDFDIATPPPPPGTPPSTSPAPPPPGTVDASGLGGNMIDGLLSTAWLSNKVPYAIFNLGFPLEIGSIKINFLDGDKKIYFFDLAWSVDKSTWNNIAPPSTTTWKSGKTATWETFSFSSIIAQYLRIVRRGNNAGTGSTATNDAFGISEVQLWGPDVPGAPPSGGGTAPPPPGTGTGQWVWTGTDWVWVPGGGGSCSCNGTPPSGAASGIPPPPTSTGGTPGTTSTTGGTGTDTGTTGPNIPAAAPPIVTIIRDFIDSYNLGVETGDLCATDNFPQSLPLVEIYNSPVASAANYLGMARAGSQCQRVGEAVMTDASQLIGQAPRKVTTTLKRVGTCYGLVYCRIRDSKNNIMQELGTYPAGVVGLNDTQVDFQNDAANYVLKKGDVIWIEYTDPSANDGLTYLMYKHADKDNYDAINTMFVRYTSTAIPDGQTDLAALIYV